MTDRKNNNAAIAEEAFLEFAQQCYEVARCAHILAQAAEKREDDALQGRLQFTPNRQDIQWVRSMRAKIEALASEIARYT